jgi:hypothetical protein
MPNEPTAFALAISLSGVPYSRAPREGDAVLDGPRAAPIAEALSIARAFRERR